VIDDSPFSAQEWTEALVMLENFLKARDLEASDQNKLGYLKCCVEALRNQSALPRFEDHVRWMIETYGMEKVFHSSSK
jgi:hypothetical protein